MEQEITTTKDKLFKLIGLAENAVLLIIAVGILLRYKEVAEGKPLLQIGLAGTAIFWFILAFKRREVFSSQQEANEFGPYGFTEMLAWIILPKILWIGSAVSMFGVFSHVTNFESDGNIRIMMIGGLSVSICLLILMILVLSGVKKLNMLVPVLIRAVTILIVISYIIFGMNT